MVEPGGPRGVVRVLTIERPKQGHRNKEVTKPLHVNHDLCRDQTRTSTENQTFTYALSTQTNTQADYNVSVAHV